MNVSSKPSAFRSPTLGPHGQKFSAPIASEASRNLFGPSFRKNEFPQMLVLPFPTTEAGHFMVDFIFSRDGSIISLMSECMSVLKISSSPSLLKSKTLIPLAPHAVRGHTSRLFLTKRLPPAFS